MNNRHKYVAVIVVIILVGIFTVNVQKISEKYHPTIITQPRNSVAPVGNGSDGLPKKALSRSRAQFAKQASPSSNSPQLPPPGTPLKGIYASLKALADSGDADAATRLFRDTTVCAQVKSISANIQRRANTVLATPVPRANTTGNSSQQAYSQMLDRIQNQQNFIDANAALCDGLTQDQIDSAFPNSLVAAQLGDPIAADCFVNSGAVGVPPGLINNPDLIRVYAAQALQAAQLAVENGDWPIVGQLQMAYGGIPLNLLSQVTGVDPVQQYRYSKLFALHLSPGANLDRANQQLSEIAQKISRSDEADAQAWAQDTYARIASNPNVMQSGQTGCQSSTW